MSDFHTLGEVEELLPSSFAGFAYPEFAVITPLLSDGVTEPNGVIQSSAPSFRRATVTWAPLDAIDVAAIRGYAESKELVAFIDEDGTGSVVVVFDFASSRIGADQWSVAATLVEVDEPGSGS